MTTREMRVSHETRLCETVSWSAASLRFQCSLAVTSIQPMSSSDPILVDAGHPRPSDDDEGSDTFEMANLEDVAVTPNPHKQGYHTPFLPDDRGNQSDSEDDDDEGDEEGGRALLGPSGRTRGRERSSRPAPGVWKQVKGIVIEVSTKRVLIVRAASQSALQTAPTLLLTTVGLLFTGELLNNVSVCPFVRLTLNVQSNSVCSTGRPWNR